MWLTHPTRDAAFERLYHLGPQIVVVALAVFAEQCRRAGQEDAARERKRKCVCDFSRGTNTDGVTNM